MLSKINSTEQQLRQKPKIVYGIQGEGRGHATRSLQVLMALKKQGYDVHIYTGGDASALLKQHGFKIRNIPMFRYQYAQSGRLSFLKTALYNISDACKLFTGIGTALKALSKEIKALDPFLIISDFEPYTCRLANKLSIPLYSVNHQHFLTESQLPKLQGIPEQIGVQFFALFAKIFTGRPDKIFASSFFHFPKKKNSNAFFIGPFLEKSWQEHIFTKQEHVTVYLKKNHYIAQWLPIFKAFPNTPFHVFSDFREDKKILEALPNVECNAINREKFLNSLANCKALISTAGNQVLGEAIYAQKPILAFPEPNVLEQELNGIALSQSGFGISLGLHNMTPNKFQQFLNQYVEAPNISNVFFSLEKYDGTQVVLQQIDYLYQNTMSPTSPPRATAKNSVTPFELEVA